MSHQESLLADDRYVSINEKKPSKAKWVIPLFLGAIGYGTYQYLSQNQESAEDLAPPMITLEDQSEDINEQLAKEFNFLANEQAGRIPSIDMMQRGVNFFNGDAWGSRPPKGAWKYSYEQKRTTSAPYNWLVPDQLMNTPSAIPGCVRDEGVTEVYESNSLEMLKQTSSSSTTGFKREIKLTGELSIGSDETGKASVGAETTLRTSWELGNSQLQREAKRESQENYSYQMSNKARAEIFQIYVDGAAQTTPEFRQDYEKMKDSSTVHDFVVNYGSHWIEKGKFGAEYMQQVFMDVNNNYSSAENFRNSCSSSSFELWGFHTSSNSATKELTKKQNESKVKNIRVRSQNKGSIDFSNQPACKDMGSKNLPALIDEEVQPYWVLPDVQQYSVANEALKNFNQKVYEAANNCRAKHCQNKGDCQPNIAAWDRWRKFESFDAYFRQGNAFCLKRSNFKEQRDKERREREAEVRRSEFCVELFQDSHYNGGVQRECLNENEPTNTLVFPSFGANNDQMSSIRVGAYVIANVYEHNYRQHGVVLAVRGGPGQRMELATSVTKDQWWDHYKSNDRPKPLPQIIINDFVSAASIVKKSASICLYEDGHFTGYNECFPYNSNDGFAWYNLHPIGWGDIVTGIQVPKGVSVRMFSDHNQQGEYDDYGEGNHNAKRNDFYSSMRVCRGGC